MSNRKNVIEYKQSHEQKKKFVTLLLLNHESAMHSFQSAYKVIYLACQSTSKHSVSYFSNYENFKLFCLMPYFIR
uniref:Uncharacterized protein n=1 Tax=Anguilla anguilla TaxID=7936 RepID=A0A0E9S2V9_ANGAN